MMPFQDYMLFDPFIYHGMAETHDRHRDMRLDVDNMSYEVKRDCCFMFSLHIGGYSSHIATGTLGIVGIRRTHRRCEHWTKRGNHSEVDETAEVFIH